MTSAVKRLVNCGSGGLQPSRWRLRLKELFLIPAGRGERAATEQRPAAVRGILLRRLSVVYFMKHLLPRPARLLALDALICLSIHRRLSVPHSAPSS